MPPFDRKVTLNNDVISVLSGTGSSSKFLKILETTVFISKIANLCPIQFLGPALNGINAYGCRFSQFSGKNLDGSNFSGSG